MKCNIEDVVLYMYEFCIYMRTKGEIEKSRQRRVEYQCGSSI